MFGGGSLTLREFAMKEPLPLAKIQDTVPEFLRHRKDAVLFGAQAVNAYVDAPRMTQGVDVLSTRAWELAEELRAHLATAFGIALRILEVAGGRGFRIFQLRQPKNRHLVDIRQVQELPPTVVISDIRIPTPEELIAQKVISASRRQTRPKGDSDHRDIKVLLLAHPHLKTLTGAVLDRLKADGADRQTLQLWEDIASAEISPDDSEGSSDW